MNQKKVKIAYHEAGHAVMALISGQKIVSVSLKEMDSPNGTDKYLGSTILEPFERNCILTINELTRRVMISLGGYASEILLLDGSANIGGDDLTSAVKWTELMMLSEEFRNLARRLPIPESRALDIVGDPVVRAAIDYQIHMCIEKLRPLVPAISHIARALYEIDEIEGDKVRTLFESLLRTQPSN